MAAFDRKTGIVGLAAALALCLGASRASALEVRVQDRQGAPLRDAVVYAIRTDGAMPRVKPAPAAIVQQDRMFMPLVTVVQKGASVDFPNHDDIAHDVYSFSPPRSFELKLYRGASRPVVMSRAGLEVIGCNIHDTMLAYVLVVDTPYFARTDAQGLARLPELPRGSYRVLAWDHRQRDQQARAEQTIRVPAAGPLRFSLSLGPR
ncbi:methylamine utilization protein [Burkholderia sp. Ap-962]|uniref:methylamine utilization protein n=1 Tax=Burkholderia sp. Ap-962 TaxID=2608333 RepID=UPI001F03B67E|nr:methylamine utilization protein [Burkholderia sp. Ap-962]